MNPPDRPASLRYHPGAGAVVAFGPFHFDRANRLLFRGDEEISLPPRVLGVLEYLIDRAGKVVSKEALIEQVWKGTHVTDTSPAEAVSLLRQALGDEAQSPRYVQTVHRRGYRFVARLSSAAPVPGEQPLAAVSEPDEPTATDLGASGTGRRPAQRLALGAAVALAVVAAYVAGRTFAPPNSPAPEAPAPTEFSILLPEGDSLLYYRPSLSFSRDGRWLAITLFRDGETRLALRGLDSVELRELPGTEGGAGPFFSPDGRWIAFFADGQLKRVPMAGGQPVTIAPAPKGMGGVWAEDGTIYFGRWSTGGLWSLAPGGGEPRLVTHPDPGAGEVAHVWPALLPQGRGLLYTVLATTFDDARIAAQRLGDGPARILVEGAGQPVFVPPDRLVFVGASGLQVAGFDPERLELTSPPEPLPYPVSVNPTVLLGVHALSPGGSLAFRPGTVPVGERRIALLDEAGRAEYLELPNRFFRNLAWDPIHRRFAASVLDGERSDIWIGGDGMLRRFTFEGFNIEPRWSTDGRRVAFASGRGSAYSVWERPADGSEPPRLLLGGEEHRHPDAWRPDGQAMLFGKSTAHGGLDLWLAERRDAGWRERPFLATEADEIYGSFSPDGRWIAYLSNASGRFEVFVRPAEGNGGPWQVSHHGGLEPQWSPDGSEIYFPQERGVMAVPFSAEDEIHVGEAVRLFEATDLVALRAIGRRRFIAIVEHVPEPEGREEIRVVLDAIAPSG